MNFKLLLNEYDYTDYVVSVQRSTNVCSPIGTLELNLAPTSPGTIETYWWVKFYENNMRTFTGHVDNVTRARTPEILELTCKDVLVRTQDCWITEEYISNGESVIYWITKFLSLAGLGPPIVSITENYSIFPGYGWRFMTVREAIESCLQMCPYQIFSDGNGCIHLIELTRSGEAHHTIQSYVDYEQTCNDSWIRNRAVVFGSGFCVDKSTSNADLLPGEKRAVILATGQVHNYSTADHLANRLLDEFGEPWDVKVLSLEGSPQYKLGQKVDFTDTFSGYHKEDCIITEVEASLDGTGYRSKLTLDEKCTNFWGWDSIPIEHPPVYAGLYGGGVYKTEFNPQGSANWYAINEGLTNLYVHDLKITEDGLTLWAATQGGLFKRATDASTWIQVSYPDPEMAEIDLEPKTIATSALEVFVLMHRTASGGVWLYKTEDEGETWTWVYLGGRGYVLDWDHNNWPGHLRELKGNAENTIFCYSGHEPEVYKRYGPLDWRATNLPHPHLGSPLAAHKELRCGGHSTLDGNEPIFAHHLPPLNAWEIDQYGPGAHVYLIDKYKAQGGIYRRQGYITYPSDLKDRISNSEFGGRESGGAFLPEVLPGESVWYRNFSSQMVMPYGPWNLVTEWNRTSIPYWGYIARFYYRFESLGMGYDVWQTEWSQDSGKVTSWCLGPFRRRHPNHLDHTVWITRNDVDYLMYRDADASDLKQEFGIWKIDEKSPGVSLDCPDQPTDVTGFAEYIDDPPYRTDWIFVGGGTHLYMRIPKVRYVPVCSFPGTVTEITHHHGEWYAIVTVAPNYKQIYRCGSYCQLKIPTPTTYCLDVAFDGTIYIAILTGSDLPIILKGPTDFSTPFAPIQVYTTGTWAGALTDGIGAWVFGDMDEKVLYSADGILDWEDKTPSEWSDTELVRATFPSLYNTTVKAILNEELDTWRSYNTGDSWNKISDIAFAAGCARYYENYIGIFIGANTGGGQVIQYSPDGGATWSDQSSGLPNLYRVSNICSGLINI